MEWPALEFQTDIREYLDNNVSQEFLSELTSFIVTKEIYARATTTALSDFDANHRHAKTNNNYNYNNNNNNAGAWKQKAQAFLEKLRASNDDHDKWHTHKYRDIAHDFTELMASAQPRAKTLALCQGGLDAVHDLIKYRMHGNNNSNNNNNEATTTTLVAAKDAFVMSQSFPKLQTETLTGTRAPDIDFRFGLLTNNTNTNTNTNTSINTNTNTYTYTNAYTNTYTNTNQNTNQNNYKHKPTPRNCNNSYHKYNHNIDYDVNSLFDIEACNFVNELRQNGTMETSAASLAKHTLVNPNLVSQLTNINVNINVNANANANENENANSSDSVCTSIRSKDTIFVVLGCDHPLAPTKSLLRIPGVTVLGIPSGQRGLNDIVEFVRYNSPDDTTFVYPSCHDDANNNNNSSNNNNNNYGNGDWNNLILSRGPQVAQWILDNIKQKHDGNTTIDGSNNNNDNRSRELVLVPMPLPPPAASAATIATIAAVTTTSTTTAVTEASVRWAASSDLILQRVSMAVQSGDNDTTAAAAATATISISSCSLWSYQSSTTCMVVPPASTTNSTEFLQQRPYHEQWLHTLSMGTVLIPTIEEDQNRSWHHNNNNNQTNSNSNINIATTLEDLEQQTASVSLDNNSSNNNNTGSNTSAAANAITTTTTAPSTVNHDYSIVNGIVTSEGPHHVLSEHIRLWRAMVTNYSDDLERSSRFYDSDSDEDDYDYERTTATRRRRRRRRNEVHVFAPHVPITTSYCSDLGLGMGRRSLLTAPLQILNPGTAASLMAAIALAGLTDPIVNRPLPLLEDDYYSTCNIGGSSSSTFDTTPFAIFWNGSVHSGVWNCPYTLDSIRGNVGHFLGKIYDYYHGYIRNESNTTATTTAMSSLSSFAIPNRKKKNKYGATTLTATATVTATPGSTTIASGSLAAPAAANGDSGRGNSNKSIVDMVPSMRKEEE